MPEDVANDSGGFTSLRQSDWRVLENDRDSLRLVVVSCADFLLPVVHVDTGRLLPNTRLKPPSAPWASASLRRAPGGAYSVEVGQFAAGEESLAA